MIFKAKKFTGKDYTIPVLDLSVIPEELKGTKYEDMYNIYYVDKSKDYMAHPDSVLLKNGNILTLYPAGHGKGAVCNKISTIRRGRFWLSRFSFLFRFFPGKRLGLCRLFPV